MGSVICKFLTYTLYLVQLSTFVAMKLTSSMRFTYGDIILRLRLQAVLTMREQSLLLINPIRKVYSLRRYTYD